VVSWLFSMHAGAASHTGLKSPITATSVGACLAGKGVSRRCLENGANSFASMAGAYQAGASLRQTQKQKSRPEGRL
jgi:hypothetical protein